MMPAKPHIKNIWITYPMRGAPSLRECKRLGRWVIGAVTTRCSLRAKFTTAAAIVFIVRDAAGIVAVRLVLHMPRLTQAGGNSASTSDIATVRVVGLKASGTAAAFRRLIYINLQRGNTSVAST
jgi:hypothetical protein